MNLFIFKDWKIGLKFVWSIIYELERWIQWLKDREWFRGKEWKGVVKCRHVLCEIPVCWWDLTLDFLLCTSNIGRIAAFTGKFIYFTGEALTANLSLNRKREAMLKISNWRKKKPRWWQRFLEISDNSFLYNGIDK